MADRSLRIVQLNAGSLLEPAGTARVEIVAWLSTATGCRVPPEI